MKQQEGRVSEPRMGTVPFHEKGPYRPPSGPGRRLGVTTALRLLTALYIVSVPTLAYLPSGADWSQAIGVMAFVTYGTTVLLGKARLKLPSELALLGVFVAYTFVGGFTARSVATFLSKQITLVQLWALTVLVFNVLSMRPLGHHLGLRAYLLGMLISGGVAVLDLVRSGALQRVSGTMLNPNSLGLAAVLGVATAMMLPHRTRAQLALKASSVLFFACVGFLTGSRKAMLGILVMGLILSVLYLVSVLGKKVSSRQAIALVLVAAGLTAAITLLPAMPHWSRLENVALFLSGEEVREGSLPTRAWFLQVGLQVWRDHPLFGVGTDQFRYYGVEYGARETYSHSNFTEVLANFGIIGFLIYYGLYVALTTRILRAWRRSRKVRWARRELAVIAVFWVTWVGLEVASVNYFSKTHWLAVAFVLAAVWNLDAFARKRVPEQILAGRQAQ